MGRPCRLTRLSHPRFGQSFVLESSPIMLDRENFLFQDAYN